MGEHQACYHRWHRSINLLKKKKINKWTLCRFRFYTLLAVIKILQSLNLNNLNGTQNYVFKSFSKIISSCLQYNVWHYLVLILSPLDECQFSVSMDCSIGIEWDMDRLHELQETQENHFMKFFFSKLFYVVEVTEL